MRNSSRYRRKPRRLSPWLLAAAILAAATALLWLAAFKIPLLAAGARGLGLVAAAGLSAVLSIVPFPLSEWLLLLIIPAIIATAVVLIRRRGAKKGLLGLLCRLAFLLCLTAFLFMLNLGVHYGAPPLAETIGLEVGLYSAQQLAQLDEYMLQQANYWAGQAPRNQDGQCDFGDFDAMSRCIMEEYRRIAAPQAVEGLDLGCFDGTRRARPKKTLLLGTAMSYLDVAGYYFPWTGESVVSSNDLDVTLPFTIAHEAAHAHGVAPENEANFAAFLACTQGQGPAWLQYAGWFRAYIYVDNALYRTAPDLWAQNAQGRGQLLNDDIAQLNAHLAQYDTPAREVGSAVNDTYIKATGQPDGVQTYGMVVDLLLGWYYR